MGTSNLDKLPVSVVLPVLNEEGNLPDALRSVDSVVLPVLNEEGNLPDALRSVDWADEVFVVDSGSATGRRHR